MTRSDLSADQARTPSPWLTVVGIGEGGWAALSEAAREAVAGAELLVGGERHLGHVPVFADQERLVWPSPFRDGINAVLAREGRPVCVLASGDPFWFGVGATLCRYLPPSAMRVFPGPSAFSLAAARLSWPLQTVHCVSMLARAPETIRPVLGKDRKLLVLGEDGDSPAKLARVLCESGYGASRLTVLSDLGGPAESMRSGTAEQWRYETAPTLNTMAVDCELDAPSPAHARVPGRHEDAFYHDGQISKREVRAVILAQLAPRGGEHLWDIGAGSGSVAVEWLLADRANQATAVEMRADRLAGIRDNAHRFGVDHLGVVQGQAPEVLADLPVPDAVFIGGGASTPGLIDACWQALTPGGRCVAAAVTLEGEAALTEARARHGGQLTRIAVDRAEPLGRFQGWRPLRPVTLWSASRPIATREE